MPTPAFLTAHQIADDLAVHIVSVRRWIRTGQLPAYRVGTAYRVSVSDYRRFLQKRKVRGLP